MLVAQIFAATGLLAVANGHIVMSNPKPFVNAQADNGPLASTGADFPCKIGTAGISASGAPVNTMAVGSNQTMSFTGTAVHGGGACQVSLTTDTTPTKDSKWKVIHTIQGGCPAREATGNLDGNSAALTDPYTYDYTIPGNLAAGTYTLAWSWVNRIGNDEFYMNCAAVELTGSGGDASALDALPDMFVVNIASENSCSTASIKLSNAPPNVLIPNPGTSVETNSQFGSADIGCAAYPAAGSGSGSATSVAATSVATTPVATSTKASVTGGVFITTPVAASSATASTTAKAGTTLATSVVSSAPAATATSGSSTGSSGQLSGACTSEGMFNCISGSSYQQCASGTWSVVMPLAAGTSCTAGQSTGMKIAALGKKRSIQPLRV